METGYQKKYYPDLPGFRLHHTAGPNAADSTTSHLHLNASRMVLYCIRGSGNIVVEDKAYHLQTGDVLITDSAELFHCTIDPNSYHERISIHINAQFWNQFPWDTASLFRCFTNREKGVGNLIPAKAVESSGFGKLFQELLTTVQQSKPTRDMAAVSQLIQLLLLLNRIAGSATVYGETSTKNPQIQEILQYLNHHCTKDISVDSIAQHFHITPSHLAHQFKVHTGFSPWNYVILRRLHNANVLMRKGVSAEEACYAVGFDNYANFYRLYKRHTGISPSQFKKQIR